MDRRSLIIALLALDAFVPLNAAAGWESLPEFVNLTEEEQASLDRPSLLGAEYESDLLTFTKRWDWEYALLSSANALELSWGSISPTEFLIDDRLKVRAPLNDFLEFRFTYLNERNFERENFHTVTELIFRPMRKLGVSLYGDPSFRKRKNDVGLALLFNPTERHEIRLFNTWVDVTRIKRNDQPDTFIRPNIPYARGVVGRIWSDPEKKQREFLEYAIRYEPKTKWLFPDEGYLYEYWKWFASLYGSNPLAQPIFNTHLRLNLRIQVDRKFESRTPESGSMVEAQGRRTDRALILFRTVFSDATVDPSLEVVPGLEYAYRKWIARTAVATYHDFLPHIWLRLPRSGFEFGYEFTSHQTSGPRGFLARNDFDDKLQHRFNLGYEIGFSEKASLRLLATFDLDEFGTNDTWEGGSSQFQLRF